VLDHVLNLVQGLNTACLGGDSPDSALGQRRHEWPSAELASIAQVC
jgi:hypothetical protein